MLTTDIGVAVVSVAAAVFVPERAYLAQASNVQGLYIGLGPRALGPT